MGFPPVRAVVLASVLALGIALPPCVGAQGMPGPASPTLGARPAAPAPAGTPGQAATDPTREPRVEWHVAEDEQVRVEELRVRGESRHITVQPKLPGARPYEIVPASGALDPSQRGRRTPGTSQWRVLSF